VNTKIGKGMLASCLLFNFATAGATIILDTPTTLVVHEVLNDNVVIDDPDAKLVVASGGVVRNGDPTVRIRSGEVDVIGNGRVIAGPRQPPYTHLPPQAMLLRGLSTVRLQDQATVVGEIYSDLSSGWKDESASVKLYLQDQSLVDGNIEYSGYLRIKDQAIVRGNIGNAVYGNIGVDMSGGGLVTGSVRLGAGNVMMLNMDGGAILGGVQGIWGNLDLTMRGGTIERGIRTGATVRGEISGGRINDGVLIESRYSGDLRITGGQFDTSLDDWLIEFASERGTPGQSGLLEIWGGQFGYADAGRGFLIDDLMSLSVFGRDLVYSNGWLTGYLMDGSWFSNALTFGSDWRGTFTIHNVPEPETLGLLLVGLVGMTLARRKAKRRAVVS
jgi:hypothetical protein